MVTDPQLQLLKRVNTDPAFLQKTKEAIQAGQPTPDTMQRPPYIKAFETQPLAKAVAMYPKELAGAGLAMTRAEQHAKQFPLSHQADFMAEVKEQLTEQLCKNGPLPVPKHAVQHPHTLTPTPPVTQTPRHELAPKF